MLLLIRYSLLQEQIWDRIFQKNLDDFSSENHSLYWKSEKGNLIDLRYLDESRVTRKGSGSSPDSSINESGKEKITSMIEVPAGGAVLSGSASFEDNRSLESQTEDYRLVRMGLASKAGEGRFTWNTSVQVNEVDVDGVMENARRTSQADLNVGIHTSQIFTADIDLKSRLEENFDESDSSRPDRLNTQTGETRIEWKPKDTLTVNFKGSVEQRSRILYEKTTNDTVLDSVDESEETSSTIITENPVLTLYTSDSIEWRPSSRWDHRVAYRQRQEKDAVNGEIFSENLSTDYRLKFAPSRKLRFTSDLVWSDAKSTTAHSDRGTHEASGEALYNLSDAVNFKVHSRYTSVDDRILDTEDENVWERGVLVEREFSRSLVARTGFTQLTKDGSVSLC